MSVETTPGAPAPAAAPPPEAPSKAPAAAPTPPAPAADPEEADNAPPPAAAATAVDYAAAVMKQRDARELASLVREKRQLEAERAKFKEREPKLAALEKIERLMDDGDRAGAIVELHRLKYGDKAAEELAESYNGLTQHVLGVQNNPQNAKVERSVSRIQEQLDALKHEKAQAEARVAEMEARDRDQRIHAAIDSVGTFLKDAESDYPYLLAEADAPEHVVWGILEKAAENDQELTLEEAARLANDHFRPAFEKKAPRYQNLLAPTKATGSPTKPEASTSPIGQPPRKSLTNADASQAPADKTTPPPRNETERLDRSFAVLQQGLNKQ